MGRPRKRPHIDMAEESRKEAKTDDVSPIEASGALTHYPVVNLPFDGNLNLDLDMCFLDVTNTDINFVDIFDPNFQFGSYGFPFSLNYDMPLPGPAPGQMETMPKEQDSRHGDQAWMDSSAAVHNTPWQPNLGGYLPSNVNFDVQTPISASSSSIQQYSSPFPKREQPEGIYAYPDYASSYQYPDTSQSHHHGSSRPASLSEVSESTVPHLTPGGSSSTSPCDSTNTNDHHHTSSHRSASQCACGDSLREAMQSLRYVPTDDITQALYTVRTVTRIAHETILCSICGDPPSTPYSSSSSSNSTSDNVKPVIEDPEPPVSAIQNMVLLAALLPSLSSWYTNLLDMVDKEHDAARSADRNIFFDLEGYGGLWGPIATAWKRCEDMVALLAQPLPPTTWRLMARAMLKLDVYGQGGAPEGTPVSSGTVISLGNNPGQGNSIEGPCETVVHIGLKDIFARMEERSRRRQERLEALLASGELELELGPSVPLGGFVIGISGSGSEKSASPPTSPMRTFGWTGTAPKSEAKDGGVKKSQGMRIIDSAKSAMDKLLIP